MAFKLSERRAIPKDKWFHYRRNRQQGGLEKCEASEATVSLLITYASPDAYRAMLSQALSTTAERRALNTRGVKAVVEDANEARRIIAKNLLANWKLTVAGAYALEFEGDLSGDPLGTPIEFTPENVAEMVERSALSDQMNQVMTTHSEWFAIAEGDEEEDGVGNSGCGPSGSTAVPPAPPA